MLSQMKAHANTHRVQIPLQGILLEVRTFLRKAFDLPMNLISSFIKLKHRL